MVWGYDETDRPWHDDITDLWRTSMTSSWDSMNPTTRTSLTSHQRRLLLLGLNCKLSTQTRSWLVQLQLEETQIGLIHSLLSVRFLDAELTTWPPMIMMEMQIMS